MGLTNIAEEVRDQLIKRASLSLCSNVPGQVMVELMVNPPQPGDFSYESYQKEFTAIFGLALLETSSFFFFFFFLSRIYSFSFFFCLVQSHLSAAARSFQPRSTPLKVYFATQR
jgi:hypothetical protein